MMVDMNLPHSSTTIFKKLFNQFIILILYYMKTCKITFLLGVLMLTSIFSYETKAQNSLNTGDIAIVGFNSDTTIDELAIVTLAEIPSGQNIYISDYAWDGNLNALDANGLIEGVITWSITTTIPAGTLFKVTINSSSGNPIIGGLSFYGTASATGWTSLNSPTVSGGDNWFIYQGSNATTPSSWVFGFANWSTGLAGTNSWLTTGIPSSTTSYLPTALTNGVNAIALTGTGSHADNMVYTGPTSGSKATLLGNITTPSNWAGDELIPQDLDANGTNFSGSNPVFSILPTFENSTPKATSIATTGFILETDIDKVGTIYYVVLADGATAPTATEVKAGTGNGATSAITSGNAIVSSGGFTNNFSVTGLTENTAYDVYVVAQDDEATPNLQVNPTKIDVTTLKPIANIVISEIMYNPPESNTDVYEYIELYNAGTSPVDLTGYSFSQGVTHTFTTGSIGVGEYFVIAVNATKLDEAFGAGTADAQWSSGSVANSGEDIELLDDLFRVVDYVDYDDNTPWPTGNPGPDGYGTSIELRDITFDNNIGASWTASTDTRDIRTNTTYGMNLPIKGTPGTAFVKLLTPINNTLYVNKTVSGGNGDGSSWANAIPELADALIWAKNNEDPSWTTTPLQVFVAIGTYKPLYSPADSDFGTDQGRDNSFSMVNNVQIYGGFDPSNNINTLNDARILPTSGTTGTILSADVNDDDGSDFANNSENLIRVVVSSGNVGSALLNGFTIRGANGEYNDDITVNGNPIYQCSGAGIYNSISSPVYENLLLQGNYNTESGGGMFSYQSSPKLSNTVFKGNKAKDGGAIASQDNSNPTLINVALIGNTATNNGGAIYNVTNSSPTFVNITVANNTDTNGDNGMHNADTSAPNVYNCIVWGGIGGSYQAENSMVEGSNDTTNGNLDATGIAAANIFNDPANGDYTLKAGSIAVNAGSNTSYTTAGGDLINDTDLAGNPRLFQNTIDMGAYESQIIKITPDANNILYVDKDATGSGSGSTWTDALTDVQTAINAATAGGKIFVKKGEYTLTAAIKMKEGVEIYGSFAGTETTLSARDLSGFSNNAANATILNGNSSQRVITNIFSSGSPMTSASVLDGFVVTGGANTDKGGGIYNSYASPSLTNLIISENTVQSAVGGDGFGGGVYNDNSSPTLTNVIISGNVVQGYDEGFGGGIYNIYNSSPTLINVTISGNTVNAGYEGFGGGMLNSIASSPTLTNTIVLGNTASTNAAGIGSYGSTPSITYSLVQGETSTSNGNIDATGITATAVFNDPANGDYTLKSTSPAVNAGDNTAYTNIGGDLANDTDVAGNPRLFDGSPTNDIIDMGAYELQEDVLPAITSQPTNVEICNGATTSFSVTANLATSYQWQVNTGSGFSNITNGGVYSDATTNTLSITGATATLNGYLYRVVITNNAGDTTSNAATLTVNTIVLTPSQTNAACNGEANGSATVSATGGTAPYTYLWSNSATTASIVNVTAGTYNVTITDANGCTDTSSITITEPAALVASGVVDANVTCNGGNVGAATASATGGTAPYTYLWSNAATTASIVNVTAGTYNVTITDANGCTDTSSVTITEPTALIASGVVDASVTCNGGNDGAATTSATGGTAPYTYLWSNAATTASIVNVTAGTYNVTITDANGCTDTSSVIITEPAVLAANGMATNVSCNGGNDGGNDGTIDLSVSGGTAPYTYLWNNTATTEDLTGLTAGTYSVTVTDANGCTTTESVTLTEPTMLSALATATNVSCNGGNDGTVDLSVTGGTAPYTYAWDNTATTEDMIGLTAGTYNVTVTDANGCTATAAATITESTLLVTNGTITDVSCLGSADGSIDVTVTGGTTPYTYAWDNTATTEDLSGLTAGTYTVTITDANGCTDTVPFTVTTTPDITAPIADLMNLTDITAQCEVLTTDVPTPTATDNCGGVVTTTHNVTFPITTQGTTVITWTYTDVAGNTSTQNQNVIITDTTAPVADLVALANVTDQCEVLAGNVSIPTATDNCGGVVIASSNVSFPITAQGTTVITWTYTDVNGNTSTQTQNVIITDTTAPIADLPTLADVVMECEVLASDVTIPTATDNCGGVVTVTNDATFPISTQGITVITWTYTDVNGNTSTQTQNIDVQPSPIANVSFSDATFTYDGNVQSIQVNNLPSGANVTYTTTPVTGQANGAIDVGVYTVTAVVSPPATAVNCSPITLTATLTIEQATQTINFNALPILYIEDDVDFQLQATASSGLPVTYSYTYTSDDPAATVNTTGWVSLLTSGVIQITAQQAGDNNYLPATDVIQALQINSRNANISGISLNGEVFTNPDLDLYYIIDCNDDQDEVRVVLETEVNASVNPSKEFIISTPQPGIFSQDIVVTSQDASVTKTYTITVERRFGFFDIAKQKFDNVLLVNNNPQTNGGYKFVGYEWYIDDRLVSTNQYYSAGDTSQDLLSENASYYLRLETENGDILQTCTGEVSLVHDFKASLYPNPNQPGRVLNIEMDGLGLTANKEMEINLYSLQGGLIRQWKTQKQISQVNLPESLMAGVYIVRCSMQGRHRNFKLIIE
jgi:hypothetical protein